MNNNECYLAHYGVLGMKWGVRKARKEVKATGKQLKKSIKNAEGKDAKKEAKAAYKEFKRGGRTKSQRFADVMLASPSDVRAYMHQGKSHKEAILRSIGDNMATAAVVSVAAGAARSLIRKAIQKKMGI